MKPLQIEGSPDEEDLVWVQNALISGGLPVDRVIRNGWCHYDVESKHNWVAREWFDPHMFINDGRVIKSHHPDIMVLDKHFKLVLIIEIDGSAHDDRPGRRRTYKRDKDYEEMGIERFIKINKGEEKDWRSAVIDHILELEETTDIFDV